MLRIFLLTAGLALLAINCYFDPLPYLLQMILFALGLIVVGIPHGGADRLIAMKTSGYRKLNFSAQRFNLVYWGQIALFSLFFYILPQLAIMIFLFISAYHFGETDISRANYSFPGRFLRLNYGMLILGIILLPDFSGIQSGLLNLNPTGSGATVIHWIAQNNELLLLSIFGLFAITSLLYLILNKRDFIYDWKGLMQFVLLIIILYNLPLLLGFTFYFVIWHSIASLKSMFCYLLEDKSYHTGTVVKEITKNSLIVLAGICFVGYICSLFFKSDNLVLYAIIGLAALTGPHMEVMHGMYRHKGQL